LLDNTLSSRLPERIKRLNELAHNIWWSWHPRGRDVFRLLDYPLWRASEHNPVKQLSGITGEKLQAAAEDPIFLAVYDSVMASFDEAMQKTDTWFAGRYQKDFPGPIAYFSMEFALHSSLPMYAGGLGILAGDICKEASDLGLPLVGLGFMYPQGYFHQHLNADGWQQEIYQQLSFHEAPISPVLSAQGQRSIAQVRLGNRSLSLAVWLVKVGRVSIYLMDTDVEGNTAEDRQLSARLYSSDPELRIQQEIVLGIGGVRVLRALGIQPSVWHANEGHSAFMGLERLREKVAEGKSFQSALTAVQSVTVFTTHTPVPSGHDVFSPEIMDKYFADYWPSLGIEREQFLGLGRPDSRGQSGFNMTALAINTSLQRNAVSRLHEMETRKMWQPAWPETPLEQVPITHVTNGVHVPTWISYDLVELFDKYLGKDWVEKQDDSDFWKRLLEVPDKEIWMIHRSLKSKLMEVIAGRAQQRWLDGEVTAQQVLTMGTLLNSRALTIGFSRRFTGYKRPALILYDTERLKKIVNNPWRPVQIIFAGKSHPADLSGKYSIHNVCRIARDRAFQGRVAFIEDYDMHLARYLTQGIDVWLNNPLRLLEASGTSGMKAGINGVLNMSVRDGWWEEGYNERNGFAIGANWESAGSSEQDRQDAESIYRLLEDKIIPLYYEQDRSGVPHEWVKMVKESIVSIMPNFSTSRMVKEYTEKLYYPLVGGEHK
jgi:starch phosphorylase